MFFKFRLYFFVVITISIWTLLSWNYFHGGVPSHHILANKDLPKISNGWGGLLLPFLTWFLLYRVHRRIFRHSSGNADKSKSQQYFFYGLTGSLLFGILLATFFTFGYSDITGKMVLGLFPLALFLPIYRAECLLGFVMGMTYTFGAVLPTGFGALLVLICAILYLYIRPGIIYISSRLLRIASSK